MHLLSFFFILFFTLNLWSQNYQQIFLESKRAYSHQEYDLAIQGFSKLIQHEELGKYAQFYMGLSFFYKKNNREALKIFEDFLKNASYDKHIQEANYWLCETYFAENLYEKALKKSTDLDTKTQQYLFTKYLDNLNFDPLLALQKEFPENEVLVNFLIKKSWATQNQNHPYIQKVMREWQEKIGVTETFPLVLKESYGIGVFLPFIVENLDSAVVKINQNFILDLYKGMRVAEKMLKAKGLNINILPFDTQADSMATKRALQNTEKYDLDLFIGPILKDPITVVKKYCKANKKILLNPLSSSERIFEDCEWAFLQKPSYKTMVKELVAYIKKNQNGIKSRIYYDNSYPKNMMACDFLSLIIHEGYEIDAFEEINGLVARDVLHEFTKEDRVYLDITQEEADMLREEGKEVFEHRMYDEFGKVIMENDTTYALAYYEMKTAYQPDSLDHIMVFSEGNFYENHLVGAAESQAFTLYGLGEWLHNTELNFEQLERLQVRLLHPAFFPQNTAFYQEVKEKIKETYKENPNEYHFLGFESVWWSGHMLHRYGKYFQRGMGEMQEFPTLMPKHIYNQKNENQNVSIIGFQDHTLKILNQENE